MYTSTYSELDVPMHGSNVCIYLSLIQALQYNTQRTCIDYLHYLPKHEAIQFRGA